MKGVSEPEGRERGGRDQTAQTQKPPWKASPWGPDRLTIGVKNLPGFAVQGVLVAPAAVFLDLHPVGMQTLVFHGGIIALLALGASDDHLLAHDSAPIR